MNDRPQAANGKQNTWWGSLRVCEVCGQCLCFGCHPEGPCFDDRLLAHAPRARKEGFERRAS
jgi:hypothetical protein